LSLPDEGPEHVGAEGGGEVVTDYTQFEAPPPDTLAPPPRDKPFDPEPQREKIRGVLALILVSLVVLLSVMTYGFLAKGWINGDDVQTLSPVFTALVTLTGTAVGFYFGGGKGGSR
jgi:hypothetical protein